MGGKFPAGDFEASLLGPQFPVKSFKMKIGDLFYDKGEMPIKINRWDFRAEIEP